MSTNLQRAIIEYVNNTSLQAADHESGVEEIADALDLTLEQVTDAVDEIGVYLG